MVTQEQFERARQDESYRRVFLDKVDIGEGRDYVKKLIYEPKQKTIRSTRVLAIMGTIPPIRAYFGFSGGRSKIIIFPQAFSRKKHKNVDDFVSTLIDHEILGHAKLFYEGIDPFRETEYQVLLEHLERLPRRDCSYPYTNDVKTMLASLFLEQTRFNT